MYLEDRDENSNKLFSRVFFPRKGGGKEWSVRMAIICSREKKKKKTRTRDSHTGETSIYHKCAKEI